MASCLRKAFKQCSPVREKLLHGFTSLAAFQLLLQILETFLQDGFIQSAEGQKGKLTLQKKACFAVLLTLSFKNLKLVYA